MTNSYSIQKRIFRNTTLQTVDDLNSAPKTGTDITDRWEPINAPYVDDVLIFPSDLMATIEMDIRKNPLPRLVTTTSLLTKSSMEPLYLSMVAGKLLYPPAIA